MSQPRNYRWELFLNQAWQGINFASKAAFLAVLTPLMLRTWGADGYGLFALASAVLVSMASLDCGIRPLTRLRLCEARGAGDTAAYHFAVCEGVAAFGLVTAAAVLAAWGLAAAHLWSRWLNLPPEGDFLIAMTVTLAGLFMVSVLLLEPLAAEGRLSLMKAANTIGALAALPIVGAVVWFHGSVTLAVFVYFLCLLAPNGVLLFTSGLMKTRFWREAGRLRWGNVVGTFRSGGWFYATTLAIVAKTHALTFLVSALSGPAIAGTFYFLLRITETVGNFGVTSCETALAALAGEPSAEARARNYRHAYSYALVFCLHGALVIGFLTPLALHLWLPDAVGLPPAVGWVLAVYGLATAFSKMTVSAAIPVGIVTRTAVGTVVEALLTLVGGWFLLPHFGLSGLFLGASAAALAVTPAAWAMSRNFAETLHETWVKPVLPLRLPLLLSTLALAAAAWSHQLLPAIGAGLFTAGATVLAIKRLHQEPA